MTASSENPASLASASEVRVVISPHDYVKSKRFYTEVLQWKISREWDRADGKGVMFDTGACILELLEGYEKPNKVVGCRISMRVNDVWKLWTAVKDKSEIAYPLRENSWGDDSFSLFDPDGLELTFFTNRPAA